MSNYRTDLMTIDDRTLMQQALEALEWCLDALDGASAAGTANTVAALRARLAAPQAQAEMPPLPAQRAVIEAAQQWWCERTADDWDSADLARAVIRLNGDWEGCPECDHECDEPCMPATVEAQLRAVDCHIAQLVHEGKLYAPEHYAPPAGWEPHKGPRRVLAAAPEPVPVAQEPTTDPMQALLRKTVDDLGKAQAKITELDAPHKPEPWQWAMGIVGMALWQAYKLGAAPQEPEAAPSDQADARRYRWLRTALDWTPLFSEPLKFDGWAWARLGSRWVGKHLDAAIDAAIVQEGQNVA